MESPVGFVGIIKLTHQIILKNFKHFLCIAVISALPYAVVLDPPSKYATFILSKLDKLITSQGQLLPDSPPLPPSDDSTPLPYPLPLSIAILIFSIAISLISTPLLSFSVCRACLNHSLDLKGSLRGIPRSVMNLLLTALCKFAVLTGFVAVAMVVVVIIAVVLSAMKANPAIPMSIWALGMVVGGLYLAVSLSLAEPVAILEEKKGWEAIRRSMYLLGGRKWLAWWLSFVFNVGLNLLPISVSKEASLLWRWCAAAVSLCLQAYIVVFSMCAQVVLYLSCKSCREESLDTLIAVSAQFGPQDFSAKYADLETAKYLDLETPAAEPKW